MLSKKYSDYLEISPTFESVVDIGSDSRNKNLWREYIVGDDMENLMEALCQSLNHEGVDREGNDLRRSFWVHGTYGTGKSYAAILVKHLLEDAPSVIDEYLSTNSRLSAYRNRFMKCRNKGGDFLVIWKTGCTGLLNGNAILMEAENAIREALAAKFGDQADYADASLADAVKTQVHSPLYNWEHILETTLLGNDYATVEELQEAIDAGDLKALQRTAEVIRKNNWGLVDSLATFEKWVSAVIENNHLDKSGIFFIWDEFTEYIIHSENITILQQLSEFSKVKPLYWMFIVHKSQEMIQNLTNDRYQLITHRFHQVEFHVSADAAYDLIAGSISIRNGMTDHWDEARKAVVKNIHPFLPDIDPLDGKITAQIEHLCPMHPMTIKLLSRVAENYAASQRTMFRFMKDQATADLGFVGYINKYGPDDQADWLTPDWLWDYFFTRESDFSDKETKVPEYIRHFEESKNLVEGDENAYRVFKTALLLMALMSSTKGFFIGKKTSDGISATEECLDNCLAGVMKKEHVHDLLVSMQDSKILVLEKDARGNVRLQLPFNTASGTEFEAHLASNDKKYSRYMMFSKDGAFAKEFEKRAMDENDAVSRRMRVAVCCAETNSINARLAEVRKELERYPYKLGLLLVAVNSDAQAVAIQSTLQQKAVAAQEPRLTIALIKEAFTDKKRKAWLTAITKQEMASVSGHTGSANEYTMEANKILVTWVGSAVSGSKMIAYNGSQVWNNQYGMAQLRKTIRTGVLDVIFPYAPENIIVTNTAYKPCNEGAPLAGVQRNSKNAQVKNVLNALQTVGMLDLATIDAMTGAQGSKAVNSVAELAKLIKGEMESGYRVNLGDLWTTLQKAPYGYYDTIACGVLLGYVFSCYKNNKFTWTDSAQSPQILTETTIGKMVVDICKGRMTTDYLSAGSITWQNFSPYLEKIFNLTVAQLAEQTTGYHNTREAVTKSGAPFWVLKYLPAESWTSEDLRSVAENVIDNIQVFITQEGDIETAMSNVLQLMKGKGKIRLVLAQAFQDKNTMAAAFRTFLFSVSPDLQDIATRLSVQPEELSDKLHSVMQGAIYTWTEEQVKDKLFDIVGDYKYLEAIGHVQKKAYHSLEAAQRDLANLFKYLRIPMAAIEQLQLAWYPTLKVLYKVSQGRAAYLTSEERESDISVLEEYGTYAKDCLEDGKSVLSDILAKRQIECTSDELGTIYSGLKDMRCDATLTQFDKELKMQVGKIKYARNKVTLKEIWKSQTGIDSVREWCNTFEVPLLWIIPPELQKPLSTLLEVQNENLVADSLVVNAIQALRNIDSSILNDRDKIETAFLATVGSEYLDIWHDKHDAIIATAKMKLGSDMSKWNVSGLRTLQSLLKQAMQEKAKREKLAETKNNIRDMQADMLKERVAAFLDAHPEYCDDFVE